VSDSPNNADKIPTKTKFGGVPVKVPVPPIFAAKQIEIMSPFATSASLLVGLTFTFDGISSNSLVPVSGLELALYDLRSCSVTEEQIGTIIAVVAVFEMNMLQSENLDV
jgi:hypothetical protein